jgi:excisionase family DNA binding protein
MDEITAAQAAILTGVSERTIRRKIASGSIPARRLGRNRYAIKVSDLQMSHPFEALALRVEALEQRLSHLEAQLTVPVDSAQPGIQADGGAVSSPLPAQFSSAGVQQLFAQLAYETARLARSISFPQDLTQPAEAAPVDDEELSNQSVADRPISRHSEEAV